MAITVSRAVVTDASQVRQMVESLHSTLAVLNPLGVEIVMNTMDRVYGVSCSEQACSSKEEIEEALVNVLGKEAGSVVVREWDKKIQSDAF